MLVSEKKNNYFSVELSLREISYVILCVCAQPDVYLHALVMQKLCTVGIRNAILRNYQG